MTVPKTVKIMGITYEICQVDKLMDHNQVKLNGNIDYSNSKISIDSELSDQIKIVTIWHEVIHGLLSQANIEHDEKLVEFLGYGITGFLADNPEMRGNK